MPLPPITRFANVTTAPSSTNNYETINITQLTQTQIDALQDPYLTEGAIVYNTTTHHLQAYENGMWKPLDNNGDVIGPNISVQNDIATFADTTGNVIQDSGVSINQVPALLGAPLVNVNEISNLGHIRFNYGSHDVGIIFVDTLMPVEFITNNFGGDNYQVCSLFTGGLPSSSTTPSALLELQTTTGGLLLSRLTTTEMNALTTPVSGMAIYNSTTNQFLGYVNNNWVSLSSGGTVTSITAGTGLTGGTITTSGTISIANTGVTAGSYTYGAFTVNAQGQLTAASSGATPLIAANNLSDLINVPTARSNLGLTNIAIQHVTEHNVLVGGASDSITSIPLTNGQLLIGSTGANPIAAIPSNGTNISWTPGSGTLTANLTGQVAVPLGGTGNSSAAAYSVICGGITSTGAFQSVSGVGTSGQVLTSQGASAMPVWTSLSTLGVTGIAGTADQVLANGTVGSFQIGNVTLTTPQAIGTSSTVQFGSLKIIPSSSSVLYGVTVEGNLTGTTQVGINSSSTYNNASIFAQSILSSPKFAPTTSTTIANASCFYASPFYTGNLGTVTASYGFIYDGGGPLVGTVTKAYGGYFTNPSAGTTKIALYTDNISIGYASVNPPSNGLIVSGNVGIATSSSLFSNLTVLNSSAVYTYNEGANNAFQIYTGTTVGTDYTLYMGADKTNGVSYIQSVLWGTAVAPLLLNGRGGIVKTSNNTLDDGAANAIIVGTLQANSNFNVYGTVNLLNGTSNLLLYNTFGVAPPTYTTRSVGTKIVLYPQVDPSNVDFAIGIQNSNLWLSVPSSSESFSWYGGTTPIMHLTGTGNITLATWQGTAVTVSYGGTGNASATAYSVICGGTTSTGAFQSVSGVGTSGQVLTSQGASALPQWTNLSGIGVTGIAGTADEVLVNGTSGSFQLGNVTLTTPQPIGTSSLVQFGSLGIGYSAPSAGSVVVSGQVNIGTNSPLFSGVQSTITVAGTGPQYALALHNSDGGATTSEVRLVFAEGGSWYQGISGHYNNGAIRLDFSCNGASANTWNNVMSLYYNGGLAIGSSYVNTLPPANGLIVENRVIIGNSTPILTNTQLEVYGYSLINSSGIGSTLPLTDLNVALVIGTNHAASGEVNFYATYSNPFSSVSIFFDWWGYTGSALNRCMSLWGNGGLSIGTSYAATLPPANGLIVSGNVGIGTNSPSYTLDIAGTLHTTGTYTNTAGNITLQGNNCIKFGSGGGAFDYYGTILMNGNDLTITSVGDSNFSTPTTRGGDTLFVNTNNLGGTVNTINSMIITRYGLVGIGTTSNLYSTLTLENATALYSNNEGQNNAFQIYTGTTTNVDYTLYMGADKTNGVSYIQSVLWGIGVAPLLLNGRGGIVKTSNNTLDDGSGNAVIYSTTTTGLTGGTPNPRFILRSGDANTSDRIMDLDGIGSSCYWRMYKQAKGTDTTISFLQLDYVGNITTYAGLITQHNTLDDGSGNMSISGNFTSHTGSSAISLGTTDPANGAWIRNDSANMVVSTRVGDLYLGYTNNVNVCNIRLGNSAASVLYVAGNAPANSLYINSSGNVGIGTSSPTSLFSVGSSSQFQINSSGQVVAGTWQGSLIDLAHGGTNANLTASNGGIFYSTASAAAILSGTATANQLLLSGASGAPSWSTVTHPATTTANQILYSSSNNVIAGLATANNGVLVTNGSGVPSISSTLPTAVQANITGVGTVTSGTWNGSTIAVNRGGTGNTSSTAYAVICGGTTSTGAFQTVSGVGTSGQVLTSQGASALPQWSSTIITSGTIEVSETITAAGALSTTLDSIIDSRNGTFIVTLGTASIDQIKRVRLLTRASDYATVSCLVSGGGSFNLTASEPSRFLRYTSTGWAIESAFSADCPDSFYPTTAQQGPIIGTGNSGAAYQGCSIALSADGNTLAFGGSNDNSGQGAVWIWFRPFFPLVQQESELENTKNTELVEYAPPAIWYQQQGPLIGTGNTGAANQGYSVALSADGNTLAIGGYQDNSSQGAVWIWTRSGTTWTQQGSKLVGTGNTGAANQGISVSLSANGNTLALGGISDNSNQGAVWIWTRSGSTWTQQGSKLVGTGNTGAAFQGRSVSLSADGNTLAVGGYVDNSNQGAVWIWTRSGTTWTQQGSKLVGTGSSGTPNQGYSVALSADGNTLAIGGYQDNSSQGAVWIWTRNNTTWTQQGSKLVGTGNTGAAAQGFSVGLSADGNTLTLGGVGDNSNQGAVWIWTRSGSTWTQQGSKLVGTGNTGAAFQGISVSLSANGNTLAFGGYQNNSNQGATWVYI